MNLRCWIALPALAACAAAQAAVPAVSPAATPAQAGMLDVATLAPGFSLDMRYAGSDNFTGRPVPGYDAPRCYLLAPVAQALARVQRALQAQGHALRLESGAPNVKVQMDFYHTQIVEGDIAMTFRNNFDGIGHVQIASVPARNEPDDGEVNYPYLYALLDELGYAGWIGCEYRPRGRTEDGLGWLAAYNTKQGEWK